MALQPKTRRGKASRPKTVRIERKEVTRCQAKCSRPDQSEQGGASPCCFSQDFSGENTQERKRSKGEGSEYPSVGGTILPTSLEGVVNEDSKVVVGEEETTR